jgi:Fe-S cluster assembly protein SufD
VRNSEQQYIDLYREHKALINEHSAPVMNALRDGAFKRFVQSGFPTRKVERYKYTDVQEAFAPDYGLNLSRIHIPVSPYDVFSCDVPNLSTQLYFVINDVFYDKILPKATLPQGVMVCSLREAALSHPELVAKYYGGLVNEQDAIANLNTFLAQDGLFVYVPQGVQIEKPLQIINILRSDVELMVNRRILVVAEEGATCTLLFCDHTEDDRSFLTTQVMEVYAGKDSNVHIYELEETNVKNKRFAEMYVKQEENSKFVTTGVTLHNGTTRNLIDVALSGEHAEAYVNGCTISDQNQHTDNNTLITHAVKNCSSNELFKYVLDGQAVGAFAGRILVLPGADGTVSQETNANLLATNEARMYTQPMLEIYADDVKCNHGSTVGQLNDTALFYMQQRGISPEEARLLLQFAFVGEVIDKICLEPLKARLHLLVEKRFRGELAKCNVCKMCK